jgi:hypothetical protein
LPLTYLDQNALIALGRKARDSGFRENLDLALESNSITIVVSSWHLIETANTRNLDNALELAEFIDSVRPSWLLERRDIQRIDVEENFCKFLKVECPVKPRVTTRSAVFAALNNQADAPKFDIPSRNFVKQWIQHPEQLKILQEVYEKNADTLPRLRELTKEGKITDAVKRRVDELLVAGSLPKLTPGGIDVGAELKSEYAQGAKIDDIPSLAIEAAISEHEWVTQGGVDRNTLIDKFHLISALPYVDEIVSDDGFFHKVCPVAIKTGHVRAKLTRNAEFLARFE